jgi:hypothetical protein
VTSAVITITTTYPGINSQHVPSINGAHFLVRE